MNNDFFKGLKVIELASVLAGPAVGMFFSELGAEVIKIENKNTGGDITRHWKLPTEDMKTDHSAYYCSVNWNKQILFLDLKEASDKDMLFDLVEKADIVISNFKLKSASRLGLDYNQLRSINPKIIYAQLTGFGENSTRTAFDVVLQAETGFLYMTGEPGRSPVKMPVALIDLMAAHQLKEGILIALLKREKIGEGSFVTTSLFGSAIASLANQATNWLMTAHIAQPMGAQHPNIAPYGDILLTKDGKSIVLAAGTEHQFAALCNCLGAQELLDNKQFKTNTLRVKHRGELLTALKPYVAGFEQKELLGKMEAHGVPAGAIRNMKEVFETAQAKEMILEEVSENGAVTKRVKTVAFEIR